MFDKVDTAAVLLNVFQNTWYLFLYEGTESGEKSTSNYQHL